MTGAMVVGAGVMGAMVVGAGVMGAMVVGAGVGAIVGASVVGIGVGAGVTGEGVMGGCSATGAGVTGEGVMGGCSATGAGVTGAGDCERTETIDKSNPSKNKRGETLLVCRRLVCIMNIKASFLEAEREQWGCPAFFFWNPRLFWGAVRCCVSTQEREREKLDGMLSTRVGRVKQHTHTDTHKTLD